MGTVAHHVLPDCDSDKIYSRYRCSKENTSDPGARAVATVLKIRYIFFFWLGQIT